MRILGYCCVVSFQLVINAYLVSIRRLTLNVLNFIFPVKHETRNRCAGCETRNSKKKNNYLSRI